MSELFKPLDTDFSSYYPTMRVIKKAFKPLELYNQSLNKHILNSTYGLSVSMEQLTPAQKDAIRDIFQYGKTHLASDYGSMTKENDMRINDFIVLHSEGMPVMVKKEAIAGLSKLSDGSARVDAGNQIWITDEKYNDVVKRLFE